MSDVDHIRLLTVNMRRSQRAQALSEALSCTDLALLGRALQDFAVSEISVANCRLVDYVIEATTPNKFTKSSVGDVVLRLCDSVKLGREMEGGLRSKSAMKYYRDNRTDTGKLLTPSYCEPLTTQLVLECYTRPDSVEANYTVRCRHRDIRINIFMLPSHLLTPCLKLLKLSDLLALRLTSVRIKSIIDRSLLWYDINGSLDTDDMKLLQSHTNTFIATTCRRYGCRYKHSLNHNQTIFNATIELNNVTLAYQAGNIQVAIHNTTYDHYLAMIRKDGMQISRIHSDDNFIYNDALITHKLRHDDVVISNIIDHHSITYTLNTIYITYYCYISTKADIRFILQQLLTCLLA